MEEKEINKIGSVEEVASNTTYVNEQLRTGAVLLNTYIKRIRIDQKNPELGFDEKCVYVVGRPKAR